MGRDLLEKRRTAFIQTCPFPVGVKKIITSYMTLENQGFCQDCHSYPCYKCTDCNGNFCNNCCADDTDSIDELCGANSYLCRRCWCYDYGGYRFESKSQHDNE